MKKSTRCILIILFLLVVLFVLFRIFRKPDSTIKVTAEKVERKTIIESVSAPGKVYPEI